MFRTAWWCRSILCSAGTWIGTRNSDGSGPRGNDYVLGRISIRPNAFWNNTGNGSCTEAFASFHPGGLQFLFCDGSVKFIDATMQFNNGGTPFNANSPPAGYNTNKLGLYQRLGIRNDGNTVGRF